MEVARREGEEGEVTRESADSQLTRENEICPGKTLEQWGYSDLADMSNQITDTLRYAVPDLSKLRPWAGLLWRLQYINKPPKKRAGIGEKLNNARDAKLNVSFVNKIKIS